MKPFLSSHHEALENLEPIIQISSNPASLQDATLLCGPQQGQRTLLVPKPVSIFTISFKGYSELLRKYITLTL